VQADDGVVIERFDLAGLQQTLYQGIPQMKKPDRVDTVRRILSPRRRGPLPLTKKLTTIERDIGPRLREGDELAG